MRLKQLQTIYTHGNTALVEVFTEGPRFQAEGVHEENPRLSQSTPDSSLVAVQWLVGGRFKLFLLPAPLPYPHQPVTGKMIQKERGDSLSCNQCTNVVPSGGSVRPPQPQQPHGWL